MTLLRPDGEHARRRPSTSTLITVVVLGFLGGCAREGPVCGEGFKRCSLTCADLASDALNCGACGAACGVGELCQGGRCQCPPGTSLCGNRCVSTLSDPANCGGCAGTVAGRACTADQVCDRGQCQTTCVTPGSTQCGQSCVTLASDANNCGTCGHSCPPPQSCHGGSCSYDLVAACFNTGQVVGVQGNTDLIGGRARVGAFPQALGSLSDVLLVADGIDQRLRQARLGDLSPLPGEVRLGASPNHVWVEDPYVYVVNSLGNTLQVLRRGTSDSPGGPATPGGGFPGGLNLTTIGELNLGPTSSPQAIVKLDHDLFIPLWGGSGRVAQVDVANPRAPSLTRMFDLSHLDLRPFDGRRAYAHPGAVASAWGKIYVALENLDAGFSPAGPGMLAKIDPVSGDVTAVELGADVCLNAFWISFADDALYVSCAGKTVYGQGWTPLVVEKSGAVVLNQREERVSTWAVSCAPGSTGCLPPSVGRFAIFNHRLYLADQSGGRIFVVESQSDHRLVERRGHNPVDGGPPIIACPRDGEMLSLVIDIIAVP